MKVISREKVTSQLMHGRVIQTMVGINGNSESRKMTMGFALYSAESGTMEPHRHAEEICYVLDCQSAWIRYGSELDQMQDTIQLEPGMTIHIPEMEYHVFEYREGGFADIIFFYGQVDNLRPEDQE